MKITRVDAIPLKTGRMLVQVSTDEGIEGIGECGAGNRAGMFKAFIEDILQPIIVGKDPRRINQIWEEMFFTTHRLGPMGMQTAGIGAVDIACWDIFGKSVEMPLYDLLGGAARTRVKLYWSCGLGWRLEPEEMLAKVFAKESIFGE